MGANDLKPWKAASDGIQVDGAHVVVAHQHVARLIASSDDPQVEKTGHPQILGLLVQKEPSLVVIGCGGNDELQPSEALVVVADDVVRSVLGPSDEGETENCIAIPGEQHSQPVISFLAEGGNGTHLGDAQPCAFIHQSGCVIGIAAQMVMAVNDQPVSHQESSCSLGR